MGRGLEHTCLNGIGKESLHSGAKIIEYDKLREAINTELSSSLAMSTREGNEYPKFAYLKGLYYKRDNEPVGNGTYFIDNAPKYEDYFEFLAEYTEPFVTVANKGFPQFSNVVTDGRKYPMYFIYANKNNVMMTERNDYVGSSLEEIATDEWSIFE